MVKGGERLELLIPDFDHRDIIAGQSTVALEMLEQAADLDNVLVPLSGGGLISGVGLVMKGNFAGFCGV